MQTNTIIEDIVTRELKALCGGCMHQHKCIHHKTSTRAIIQCELFVLDHDQLDHATPALGLCSSCDRADRCTLPGRKGGVWRCHEFS